MNVARVLCLHDAVIDTELRKFPARLLYQHHTVSDEREVGPFALRCGA